MATRACLLWLGCLFSACVFAYGCPPEHLLRPCRCGKNTLVCQDIKGQDILNGVFRRLGKSKVNNFFLKNSEVEYIPGSSIERNAFKLVSVENSILSQLFERVPGDCNHLFALLFQNVTIHRGLSFGRLKPLRKLEILFLEDTIVPELGKEFSQNLSQVIKKVWLRNTSIRNLDYAFTGKHELVLLEIINAHLTHLHRASLPYPANNLTALSLRDNEIETLADDVFEGMSKLSTLDLTGNKIREISESVFGKVYGQVDLILLSDNPIKCDCSIKWITLRKKRPLVGRGTCFEPKGLAGTEIYNLTPLDFPDCP